MDGFGDSAFGGFGDSAFGGFGDSVLGGFGDSALGGFGDSAVGGFGDSAFGGFGDGALGLTVALTTDLVLGAEVERAEVARAMERAEFFRDTVHLNFKVLDSLIL